MTKSRRVGRAVRQQTANLSRRKSRMGSTPIPSAIYPKVREVCMKVKLNYTNVISTALFLVIVTLLAYVSVSRMKTQEEQRRIDIEIEEIKGEIFTRQCRLDKLYCCSSRNKEACQTWKEKGCIEEDGSTYMDCALR